MDDMNIGERWIYVEEGKNKWTKYYSSINFDKGHMFIYTNEKKTKTKKTLLVKDCEFYDAVKMKNRACTIKIAPRDKDGKKKRPKPLYVSCDDLRSIDELKVELEECDGTFEGLDVKRSGMGCACIGGGLLFAGSGGAILRLEHTDVAEWTKKDALEWLKQIKLLTDCEKSFKENDIDGSIIVELDEQTLLNIGVSDKNAKKLMVEVNRLKKNRKFSRSRFAVKSKFERFPGFSHDSIEFQEMIDSLCDTAKLKHRFLNTADLTSHTMNKKKKKGRTGGKATMTRIGYDGKDGPLEQYNQAKVKIKIVVTEILHSSRAKKMREFVSPIVNAMIPKLKTDFGFFHTALIVGPWYLEWTDSELVIPKRMVSGRAIISADVDTLNVPKEGLKEISDKISEVVVRWNTKYKYRNTPSKGKKVFEGNCQDFVDEILHAIGVNIGFTGALGEFIESMRKSGKCVLEFAPCKDFREYFGIKEKSWVFKTHEELDNFCVKIREQCLDVYNTFSSEWSLLKSFDRAFWLRHLKMPDDARYKPIPAKEQTLKTFNTGCPFDDPRNTKSYT